MSTSSCYTAKMASDCEGKLHPKAHEGILLFNRGKYFEAHEELETAWRAESGRIRNLYQGILQAAVTYLHITRGNYQGAVKVHGRSMKWLKDWPDHCRGVDVAQLRADMDMVITEVNRLGNARLGEFDRSLLKPIVWTEDKDRQSK